MNRLGILATIGLFGVIFILPQPVWGQLNVFGVGPDLTIPIAAGGKLISLITVRYQWEFGAHTTTQGQGLNFFMTFPLKFFVP